MNTLLISGVNIAAWLFVSVISSMGLAILLVEKGEEWPVSLVTKPLRWVLETLYSKLGGVLDCTVCCSFWTAFVVDLCLLCVSGGTYFLWPLSGFATAGIVFLFMDFLNILDKEHKKE